MIYTRIILFALFLIGMSSSFGFLPIHPVAEICDNGIDDDGDGLIDLNDPDCKCNGIKDSVFVPSSLVPNPSFELYNKCPDNVAQLDRSVGWIQASSATSDYFNLCNYKDDPLRGMPPQPLPAGRGYVGFLDIKDLPPRGIYKEYVGACLTANMIAGKDYTLSFWIGFGKRGSLFGPRATFNLGVFGTSDCKYLPFGVNPIGYLCPTSYPGWLEMSRATVSGINQWKKVVLKIRPTVNIAAIAIGPACATTDGSYYYWMDELILEETVKFDSLQIDITGNPCTDTIILKSSKTSLLPIKYQWYKDGIAIIGAKNSKFVIPKAATGTYILRASYKNECDLSKAFVYSINKFDTKIDEKICSGDSIIVGTKTYSKAGQYYDTLKALGGCDSILEINIVENKNYFQNIKVSSCESVPFIFDGLSLDSSGTYTFKYYSAQTCDSTIQVDFTKLKNNNTTLKYAICNGDRVMVAEKSYSVTGTYTDTLKNMNSCDSILDISVTVNDVFSTKMDTTICEGSSVKFGNKVYSVAGTYVDSLQSQFLCDSIVSVSLNVSPISKTFIDTSICEGSEISILGQKFSTNGNFKLNTLNRFSCDSIIQLNLKVNKTYSNILDRTICDGDFVEINNQKYTNSGLYNIPLKSMQSCDSNIQLNLKVNPIKTFILDTTICSYQKLIIGNKILDQSGQYNFTEKSSTQCDSNISIKLNVSPVINIQDSIVKLKCSGDKNASIDLQIQGGTKPYFYSWSNLSNSSNLKDIPAGLYTVTISDAFQCQFTKSFEIKEPECFCFNVNVENGSCANGVLGKIILEPLSANPIVKYELNNQVTFPANNEFQYLLKGKYQIQITNSNGCLFNKTVDVDYDNSFINDLGLDTIYAIVGDSISLKVNLQNGINTIENIWTGSGNILCSKCETAKILAESGERIFYYSGKDENGCEIIFKIVVVAEQHFNVPNVFSPNGDNINDFFNLISDSSIDKVDLLQIYSRWGEIVFESRGGVPNTATGAWDGTIGTQPINPGVFVYQIVFRDKAGMSHHLVGDLTLVR